MKRLSTILIVLLFASTMSMLSRNSTSASVGAANFLPNNFQQGLDTDNEISLSLATAEYITNTIPYDCLYSYGESCTVDVYKSYTSSLQNSYDQVIVFSKGHRGIPYLYATPPSDRHRSMLDHNANNYIDWADIFPRKSF